MGEDRISAAVQQYFERHAAPALPPSPSRAWARSPPSRSSPHPYPNPYPNPDGEDEGEEEEGAEAKDHIPPPRRTPATGGRQPTPTPSPSSGPSPSLVGLERKVEQSLATAQAALLAVQSGAADQTRREAGERAKYHEAIVQGQTAALAALEQRLLGHMDDALRRGVEEGVDHGVREVLARLEREREERENAAQAQAQEAEVRRGGAAFARVHLPFAQSSPGSTALAVLAADAQDSHAALRSLQRSLGSTAVRVGPRRIEEDDEAWLEGREETRVSIVQLPGHLRASIAPSIESEAYDDDEDDGGRKQISWSASDDDGDAFVRRHVEGIRLFSERGRDALRGGVEDE